MVDQQIAARGITDPRVLEALLAVPREAFVPEALAGFAHDDSPLPIGLEQTISQPYIVALSAAALRLQGFERVLEIGTGSGYGAAILGRLAREVFSVERLAPLLETARARLRALGCPNVQVRHGDGTLGWPEFAPYDAISVTACGPRVPPALLEQLAPGGRLVMPVGPSAQSQLLMRVTREGPERFREEALEEVRIVPQDGGS